MHGAPGHLVSRSDTGISLLDLPQKQGDAEALAPRLPWQQGDLPFREFAPITDGLCIEMCRQARGKEQGVLATFGAERINGFIAVGEQLHTHDLTKQVELPVIRF
jgi:hypothetical protein